MSRSSPKTASKMDSSGALQMVAHPDARASVGTAANHRVYMARNAS